VLTLGIGIIFIDQLPTFHVFKKVHIMLASKSSSLPSNLRSLMNKQTQFKVALKRYLNTHSFYSVEEFLTFRNNSLYMKNFSPYCFVVWTLHNMCILYIKLFLLYCVVLCLGHFCFVLSAFICMLCIFMTYSTYHHCHYRLMNPWNLFTYLTDLCT